MTDFPLTDFNLIPLLPEIFLTLVGMGLLIVGVTRGNSSTYVISWATALSFVLAIIILFRIGWDETIVLNGMFKIDQFAGFVNFL